MLLGIIAVTMFASGCSKYSERDKELYLSDAEDVYKLYTVIQIPDPGYDKVKEHIAWAKRENGGRVAMRDAAGLPHMAPSNPTVALAEVFEAFRRKYAKTPVDEDLGLIAKLQDLQTAAAGAWGVHEASIVGPVIVDLEAQEGKRTTPEPPTEEDVKLNIADFQQKLSAAEEAIKKARE
jgi:hypothetical protein